MNRDELARVVLGLDSVGCALAAVAVSVDERMAGSVDPSRRGRVAVAVALGATSVVLGRAAVRRPVRDRDLEIAGAVNLGWVAACCVGLSRAPSRLGRTLLLTTALSDGFAAIAQWALRAGAR
ncbi:MULTISPECIES: hypothetical protein [unclassified Rhodococcus (in: high G+C Gram-positive bacteria)]|uniref:hypothetical protein n=1 Tax=Rhodococcus sp. SJ-3 TaxID=3454628 RepID=UPI002D9CFA1C|nr:hypothetical protein [Rhodococcus sp. (in: high G+C Gram-positive bacteria)]